MNLIRPPRLCPGDRVQVVAASGPVDRESFEAGERILKERYHLSYDEEALFARAGFLAGEDPQRLQALKTAIADPECRAIFLARGGYGLLRLLPSIDPRALRAHPKPIVGFSDATALLAACARAKVAAIHGPVITQLRELPGQDLTALLALLEDPDPRMVLSDLEEIVSGRAAGPLLGGNLEVLSRLLGTPFEPDFEGAVLFLEEVGERPYRVDRLLVHLEHAGVLAAVSGIVIGDFLDCDEVENGVVQSPSAREVLQERLGRLTVPVVFGGRFGHGKRNAPLPYGTPVELDTRAGLLAAPQGVVS